MKRISIIKVSKKEIEFCKEILKIAEDSEFSINEFVDAISTADLFDTFDEYTFEIEDEVKEND